MMPVSRDTGGLSTGERIERVEKDIELMWEILRGLQLKQAKWAGIMIGAFAVVQVAVQLVIKHYG